jgi:hypothetical protein
MAGITISDKSGPRAPLGMLIKRTYVTSRVRQCIRLSGGVNLVPPYILSLHPEDFNYCRDNSGNFLIYCGDKIVFQRGGFIINVLEEI